MAEGGADQEIVTRFVVEANDALARADEYNKRVEEIKQQLMSLATTSGQSLRTVAEGMKQAFAAETMAKVQSQIKTLDLGMKGEEGAAQTKQMLAQAKTDIAQYNAALTEAVSRTLEEVNGLTKQSAKERSDAEKQFVEQQKLAIKQEEDARKQQVANEKANLNAAKAAQQEYVAAWKAGIPVMSAGAKAFGDQVQQTKSQIQQLAATTGQSFSQIGQQMVNGGKNINVVKQAIRELNSEASNTPSIFSRVGGAIQVALGIGLEQVVMRTVRAIIDLFRQAAEAGFEYAQALVKLQIGTNLLQKSGLNITMRDTLALVEQLNQQFPIFTRKSIIEGVGYMQILAQNLSLSSDQMKNLSGVSSALAVILGKDVGEATKEIALFLSSGYGEALQRAGILASKASVEHELLAMGIKESYNSVDQATRAQAGYNVIMQQASTLVEKAKDVQDSYAYSVTQLQADWQDLINTIGIRAAPAMSATIKIIDKVVIAFQNWTNYIQYNQAVLEAYVISLPQLWAKVFETLKEIFSHPFDMEAAKESLASFHDEAIKILNDVLKQRLEYRLPDIFTSFKDDAIGAGEAAKEEAQKIADATQELYDKLTEEQKRFSIESANLWTDYQRDIEKINRDGLYRQEQLFTDFIRSIAQIEAQLSEDIYNENLKYEADVADTQRDYASKRADIEQKYRDRELKAQRDFEEKMRRLREDFIMDMEDALRERDARQVLRLIRQFNVNQDRLKRERDQEHEDLQREYRQEIKDLEKQRDERLATLAREHQARIAALQRQAQIEREQAWLKYQQEMEDLRKNLENQRAERLIQYDQQRADMLAQQEQRYKDILDALVKEYNMTGTMLESTMALYRSKYGVGGELEQIYNYAAQLIAGLNSMLEYAAKAAAGGWGISGPLPTSPTGQQSSGPGGTNPGYATGGSFVASSPTIAKFGEVPELVTITPINQINKMPSTGKSNRPTTSRLAIDLFLSPDLEARIIDKTLDINADVMVDIQRRR